MATLKGQNFRICIFDATAEKYKVIGMSTGCTVTLTNNTDDGSHKDIVGAAAMPTVVSRTATTRPVKRLLLPAKALPI